MESKNDVYEISFLNTKISKRLVRTMQIIFSVTALAGVILFIVKHL